MYYIGLDVHKKTISYCMKDASGQVHQEGQIGATRWELDGWIKTLPHPRRVATLPGFPFHFFALPGDSGLKRRWRRIRRNVEAGW